MSRVDQVATLIIGLFFLFSLTEVKVKDGKYHFKINMKVLKQKCLIPYDLLKSYLFWEDHNISEFAGDLSSVDYFGSFPGLSYILETKKPGVDRKPFGNEHIHVESSANDASKSEVFQTEPHKTNSVNTDQNSNSLASKQFDYNHQKTDPCESKSMKSILFDSELTQREDFQPKELQSELHPQKTELNETSSDDWVDNETFPHNTVIKTNKQSETNKDEVSSHNGPLPNEITGSKDIANGLSDSNNNSSLELSLTESETLAVETSQSAVPEGVGQINKESNLMPEDVNSNLLQLTGVETKSTFNQKINFIQLVKLIASRPLNREQETKKTNAITVIHSNFKSQKHEYSFILVPSQNQSGFVNYLHALYQVNKLVNQHIEPDQKYVRTIITEPYFKHLRKISSVSYTKT